MFYALIGFVFCLFVPYLARRFAKFMPATFAYAFVQIFCCGKCLSSSQKQDARYKLLKQKYNWRSFMFGLFGAVVFYGAYLKFGEINIGWHLFFIWTLILLTEIDYRMFLLPDILTVPLLIVGFFYATFIADWTFAQDSAIGALFGYFMPALASLCLVWKYKDAFGGGDIKLLAAIGAWFGLEKLIYTILLSVLVFGLYALFMRKRSGAFGPAIAVSAIVIAFYFF